MQGIGRDLEEEFKLITREILKPQLSPEELDLLARRWASYTLRIRQMHGFDLGKSLTGELIDEHRLKILELRRRLGLDNPDG